MYIMNSNFTNSTEWYNDTYIYFFQNEKEAMPIRVIKIIAYSLLFLVSLLGNVSVILAVSRDNRLKSTTNILVANMAVSDTIITLLEIPKTILNVIRTQHEWLVHGDLGLALCKLLPFIADVCFAISLYTCIFIATDRYYAVAFPFKGGFSRSRLKYIISGIWVFSAVVCSPFLYSHKLVKVMDEQYYCEEQWPPGDEATMFKVHLVLFIVLTTFLPIICCTILYLLIVYKISKNKVPGVRIERSERTRRDRQNKNVLRMSVTIIALLSVSWLFFEILNILETFTSVLNNLTPSVRQTLLFAATFILLTTCTHQFWLFLIFVDIYRQNFKRMFSSCCCGWRRFLRIRPVQADSSNPTELT